MNLQASTIFVELEKRTCDEYSLEIKQLMN